MKKLGFGLMRLPLTDKADTKSIDIEKSCQMVDLFLERGFTYFDTAWMYHGFKSEDAVKDLLTSRHPRDSFQLATKLHADYFDSKADIEKTFETQLKKTGAEYFDYYLLHDMNPDYYKKFCKFGCFEWLQEKKAAGLIKHAGFSFHSGPETLNKILTEHPEVEFVQLQINYLDWESERVQSRKNYEVARKHGKPVIIMEPVKGGILALLPDEAETLIKAKHPDWSSAEWAVKFAAGLPGVMMVLSGMSTLEQVDDNTSYMSEFESLTEDEKKILLSCADIINGDVKIPCTGCGYCTDGCAAQIPIPSYFTLYNAAFKKGADVAAQKQKYREIVQTKSAASACIECGQCELICPQQLPVTKYIKTVSEYFEGE